MGLGDVPACSPSKSAHLRRAGRELDRRAYPAAAMYGSKRSRAAFEADLQAQQSPYVFFGTPLPPLDPSVRDDGSYVPVWKQEVTDERGRKRLHGAFAGGFSAG